MNETIDPITTEIRKAIEHRATWMYLLLKEARDRGWIGMTLPARRFNNGRDPRPA